MSSLTGSTTTGRVGRKIRVSLPGSRKRWALLLLALPVLALLIAGFAQIFHVDFAPASGRVEAPNLQWRDMIGVLNRYGVLPVDVGEAPGLDVLLATPQYFGALRRQPPASALAEPSLLFYVTENVHSDELPAAPPEPLLRIDGSAPRIPVEGIVLADSYHHRTTLVRYAVEDVQGSSAFDGAVLEMVFPAPDGVESSGNILRWVLPLQYSEDYVSSEVALGVPTTGPIIPRVSGVAVLAVLGGLLAAMWPCLFQLTAYFIPAMAGMSMQEASTAKGLRPRVGVVRTAFFFVLGFTMIYTLAGAAIGFGSQQLANMESFYLWQRYLSIGAGVILFVLAFRVAARARAPLVCKMPIASRMAHKGVTSPWESMLVGVTFATGCMTCFGSAVLIGMVLYVGLAGSPLVGAMLLFLFSLGMGIPLVIGAMAMARVLPLLFRIEKAIPWMGLASATLIAGYGILLVTGDFMAVSSWFYQLLGIGSTFSS
ncbi:MAG: cytochrome c biogenesis CcdA family protein [Dehalococcoidia bacterium]